MGRLKYATIENFSSIQPLKGQSHEKVCEIMT
jgi:hypothetical protein